MMFVLKNFTVSKQPQR